jgi:hypothetical protein
MYRDESDLLSESHAHALKDVGDEAPLPARGKAGSKSGPVPPPRSSSPPTSGVEDVAIPRERSDLKHNNMFFVLFYLYIFPAEPPRAERIYRYGQTARGVCVKDNKM